MEMDPPVCKAGAGLKRGKRSPSLGGTIPTVSRFPSQEIEASSSSRHTAATRFPIGEGNRLFFLPSCPTPNLHLHNPSAPGFASIQSRGARCSLPREEDPSCRRDPIRVSRHAAAEAPREGAVGGRGLQWS